MKIVPISRGLEAMVDDADYDAVMQNKWSANKSDHDNTWYAHRGIKKKGKRKHISMHRFLMGDPKGVKIDHIDGNGLNNQRNNLRYCTHRQNLMNMKIHNKHGLKGVAFIKNLKPHRQWVAQIQLNGTQKIVGYFPSKIDAAIAYNANAAKHFGEFAKLNPIPFTW